MSDEFEKADEEVGASLVEPERISNDSQLPANASPSGVVEYRRQLVEEYHKGAPSLVKRLKDAGGDNSEALLIALIDEVISETDSLLGNELVATQNGDLSVSSVISFKRAEVLEKAIKAVQTKKEFERESGIDIDSPSMMVIFKFFMAKAKDTLDRMQLEDEVKDLFFMNLGEEMDSWKKELREEFESIRKAG